MPAKSKTCNTSRDRNLFILMLLSECRSVSVRTKNSKLNIRQAKVIVTEWCMLTLLVTNIPGIQSFWAEVDVQKIGSVEYGLFQINATVKHVNRTSLAISGTMLLTNDFSDDYQGEMKMYYSSLGNNQYVLLPYVLPKKPLCYYMDTTWRQNIQPDLERVSNIPKQVENEPLCPLFKKGKYTVQQYIISKETIPTFFHAGTYKSELNIYEQKSGKLDGTIVIQMKLY